MAKFILAAFLPMTTDETYYWVWSIHPQLSYYDHPPFVGWLFWLGHIFEPYGNAVRWPAVLVTHLSILVWYLIWKEFISSQFHKFSWWLALALLTPMIGFGSVIVTPDIPVIFFWSLCLLFFLRILKDQKINDYIYLGIFLGLGFCSKYHIVLFVFIGLTYLTFERRWKEIKLKYAFLTILAGLIFSLPVIIWNFQNEFISFQFQLKHGLAKGSYEFYWTWSYVLAQFLVLFPTLIWTASRLKLNATTKMIAYFAVGPLLFFFLTSFKGLVEVNWPIIAYPAFFVLAVLGAEKIKPILIACLFWVSLFAIISSHLFYPWIPQAPERIEEFSQFKPLIEVRSQYEPLYASTYQMASWVWYTTKNPIFKLKQMSRYDFFDHFPQSEPTTYPFYIAIVKDTPLPGWIADQNLVATLAEELDKNLIIVKVEKP